MPFILPVDPPSGLYLPNFFANTWANNNRWLHAQATKNWDTFTGCIGTRNGSIANGEFDVWRGWIVYGGVPTLYVAVAGIYHTYVTDDSGSEHLVSIAGTLTGTMDISVDTSAVAMTYTVGKRYKTRITVNHTGASSWHVDYVKTRWSNAYAWPSLGAFTDGTTPTPADFAAGSTAQKHDNALLTPLGSSCYVALNSDGTDINFYNGSFTVRKLGSAMQTKLAITYKFQNGGATLNVYDSAGTLQDTFALSVTGAERTDTYTLTGTYTAGTEARMVVHGSSTQGAWVRKVTVGATIALSHAVPSYSSLDVVKGTSGSQELYWLLNENPLDIRALLNNAAGNYSYQYLVPDQTLGEVDFILPSAIGYTMGGATERDYTYRFLYYLPTALGATGTLTYGTKTVSLPDVNNSGWASYDLNSIADLAPAMSLKVHGVKANYQSLA